MALNHQNKHPAGTGNAEYTEDRNQDLLPQGPSMQDFAEGKTILTLSEVALIIKKRYDANVASAANEDLNKELLEKGDVLMKRTVDVSEYCERFGQQKTVEECARVRRVLSKLPLTPFEVVTLANLVPEDYEEAMAYVPSLKHNTTSLDVQRAVVALKESSSDEDDV